MIKIQVLRTILIGFGWVTTSVGTAIAQGWPMVSVPTEPEAWCRPAHANKAVCKDSLFGGCVNEDCRKKIDEARNGGSTPASIEAAERACKDPSPCAETREAFLKVIEDRESLLAPEGTCPPSLPNPEPLKHDPDPGSCHDSLQDLQALLDEQRCRWWANYSQCQVPTPPKLETRCALTQSQHEKLITRKRRLCAYAPSGSGKVIFSRCDHDPKGEEEAQCHDPEMMAELEKPKSSRPTPLCTQIGTVPLGEVEVLERSRFLEAALVAGSYTSDVCLFSVALGQSVCTDTNDVIRISALTAFERADSALPKRLVAYFDQPKAPGQILAVHIDTGNGLGYSEQHPLSEVFYTGANACSLDQKSRIRADAFELRRILIASTPKAQFLGFPIDPDTQLRDCAVDENGETLCWIFQENNAEGGSPRMTTWRPGVLLKDRQFPTDVLPEAMKAGPGRFFAVSKAMGKTLIWWPEASKFWVWSAGQMQGFEPHRFDRDWLAATLDLNTGPAQARYSWWLDRVPIVAASQPESNKVSCWREGESASAKLACGIYGQSTDNWFPLDKLVDIEKRRTLLVAAGDEDASELFRQLAQAAGTKPQVRSISGDSLAKMALLLEHIDGSLSWISSGRPETVAHWISPDAPLLSDTDPKVLVSFDEAMAEPLDLRLQALAHRAGARKIYLRIHAEKNHKVYTNIVHAVFDGCQRLRRVDASIEPQEDWHDLDQLINQYRELIESGFGVIQVPNDKTLDQNTLLRCLTASKSQAGTCNTLNTRALLQHGAMGALPSASPFTCGNRW